MPFLNRIRLGMQLHSAQFPEERSVFRKANGATKTMSVIVRKTYELEVDFIPERWHQRLKIALAHDVVNWEGERYLGGVTQDGDYTIEWPDGVLHYPTAKANCKVQVTPFDATNSNCQTCEEASQLSLVDDTMTGIYGALQEDQDYEASLADNDTICCYPAVFSLTSFNSDYLTSATINATTGVISIHVGTDLVSANGLLLATYRVTCPNGGYDEANVYADIEGTNEDCTGPSNVEATTITTEEAVFEWDAPGVGTFDYYWEIYEGTLPVGMPVQTGTILASSATTLLVSGLTTDTDYYFQIRRTCVDFNSIFSGVEIHTEASTDTCGQYKLTNTGDSPFTAIGYIDCNGNPSPIQYILYQAELYICALQSSPGVPVSISASPNVTIEYIDLC